MLRACVKAAQVEKGTPRGVWCAESKWKLATDSLLFLALPDAVTGIRLVYPFGFTGKGHLYFSIQVDV